MLFPVRASVAFDEGGEFAVCWTVLVGPELLRKEEKNTKQERCRELSSNCRLRLYSMHTTMEFLVSKVASCSVAATIVVCVCLAVEASRGERGDCRALSHVKTYAANK